MLGTLFILFLVASPAPAWHFHGCESLDWITHGTFHQNGDCMQFVADDENGTTFEIVNKGSWKDGMIGTIYADIVEPGTCGYQYTARICDWDADYSSNVVGTLVFLNFIECPGYYIRKSGQTTEWDYFIRNHEDFPELCTPENVGKKLKAELLVHTWVTNCIGKNVSELIDYDFLPNQ